MTEKKQAQETATLLPVVGIGSSAGGLEALTRFFDSMPPENGMAFIVVPHLDPTHESLMVELLSKHTEMAVSQAEQGSPIRPNYVYVIPPNKDLEIVNGELQLCSPREPRGMRTAIDAFLRSLARDQGERAIAIILSGTGSHGTLGLKEVKLAGGMVMVQDPASAAYDAMPLNAIATGMVDYVMPPQGMPSALIEYVRHPYLESQGEAITKEGLHEELNRILTVLRARTKYDFRCYRKNMLLRRVQRRMGLCNIKDLKRYAQRLRDDPKEITALYKDLLIGVTAFFRDPEAFHVLEQRVLPALVASSDDDAPLRIWVPACATGEEAYSIAMLLMELFAEAQRKPSFQVFATDLDEDSLAVARQGVYPGTIVADVSPERLRKFFVKSGEDGFQVNKQLREAVVFAQQSVIGDAPFSRIDLVSCRNLLIYFEPELQAKVIRLLHFALKPNGYLLLGPSESVGRHPELFETISKKWRVYQRVGPTRPDLVEIPITGSNLPRPVTLEREFHTQPSRSATTRLADLSHRLLLAEYAPASVLANRRHEILYYQGNTDRYLEQPGGQPSVNLLALARPGLRMRIRAAIAQAADANETTIDEMARVKRDGRYVPCTIKVRPVPESRESDGLFLVSFEDGMEVPASQPPEPSEALENTLVVEQLENELSATREDLQTTIEELESSNEELRVSNEEVMSMNEELQSANEELETSKEELQSMNEELSTVNNELRSKVLDLEGVNNDITNLLACTDIPTLFLDTELRIRLFTPPTAQLLSLIPADIGRHISDFSAKVADTGLLSDARLVLENLTPIEEEVWTEDEPKSCYVRRISPYRTSGNRVEGVVITFFNITDRKRDRATLEERVQQGTARLHTERHRLRSIIDNAVDAIITIDERGLVDEFNPAAVKLFGYESTEVVGNNVKMLMPLPFSEEHDQYIQSYLETGQAKVIGLGRKVVGRRKDGSTVPIHVAVSSLVVEGNQMFLGTIRDLTAIKEAEEALHREHALSEGIVKTAQAIILRLDRAGRIVSFNPYMARLCGYELEEVVGKDWFETFIPAGEREELKAAFAQAVGGERTRGRVSTLLTKGGEVRLIEWYDEELHLHGEPFTLLAIGHDITAQHELQREFLQSQKMEAIGRLSGGVAHDFNNLLAGIIGGLRIASRDLDVDHPARKTLEEVQSEVERGAAITRRLLDFSRIQKSAPKRIGLNEIIRASDKMIRRLLGEDIEIVVDCLDERCTVFADPGQIEQALLNLAINARDAMPKGGKLEITCDVTHLTPPDMEHMSTTLAPGLYATLSVSDSGCGMDEETRKQALTPFFTTKGPGLGTGLGLSSVASITEACGGALSLRSTPGEGTTVRLAIPWIEQGTVEIAPQAAAPTSAPCESRDVTILVVEDEKLVRLGIVHELEEQGYTVHSAVDAQDALEQMERIGDSVSLLLSDVVLPGMSGPELAAQAAQEHPDLRVLFMSAFPSAELVAQGRIQPDTVTLEKPFDSETVRLRVLEALA